MIIALLRRSEYLWVFPERPEDDQVGPYQIVAPELLELPEDRVRWYAEDLTGKLIIPVPPEFIMALLTGDVTSATTLLRNAVLNYATRRTQEQ